MSVWEDIEGYEGLYMINIFGEVYSTKSSRILKKRLTHDGYIKVTLYNKPNAKDIRVHRLVAQAFIPNPENKETVNHKDGNKENNHIDNLEWATRSEQTQHSYDLGLKKPMPGRNNPNAKLTDDQVREIRKLYIKGSKEFGTVALGKEYNVHAGVIEKVIKRKSYIHVY